MSSRVRVALIGCGRIAQVHRSYLSQVPEAEIVGVWDVDPDAAKKFASAAGLRSFDSLEALVEQGSPQAAHVLTPPPTHADLAVRLMEAGVSVLIEKPMAMNRAEVDRILAARKGDCWVSVDHNRWFDPVVQQAAGMLESGQLGRLVGVEVFQGAESVGSDGHWTGRLPGGALLNLASHPLYLMRRFAGPARTLRVVARCDDNRRLEEVRMAVDGEVAPAVVTMSTRARPFANKLVLLGSDATVEVNLNNMTLIARRSRRLPKVLGKVWPNASEAGQLLAATVRNGIAFVTGKQRYYPGIGAHLRTLYGNLARGEAPPVSAEEGRDVVAWYEQILAEAGVETTEAAGS